jgi:UDP-N-acetylglucosamine 2-epimerase
VKAGVVKLVGRETRKIVTSVMNILSNEEEYSKMAQRKYPYGKGDSAEKIVKQVVKFLMRKNH